MSSDSPNHAEVGEANVRERMRRDSTEAPKQQHERGE